jgi:hypothetical protein
MRCLLYLLTIGVVLSCATVYAQTPDGETPPSEGVCNDLMYATPGLYGLCVAFCEAQDCEPDFSLANPFESCKPASRKILENYRKKMQPGDPDMPCLRGPCPCWSAAEVPDYLQIIGSGYREEWRDCPDSDTCYFGSCIWNALIIFRIDTRDLTCYYVNGEIGGGESRYYPITPEEHISCVTLLTENALAICEELGPLGD